MKQSTSYLSLWSVCNTIRRECPLNIGDVGLGFIRGGGSIIIRRAGSLVIGGGCFEAVRGCSFVVFPRHALSVS